MHCPFDGSDLQVVNRSGIEIDWCPSCKGVWLERGELDKLIDQASADIAPAPVRTAMPAPAPAVAAAPAPTRYGSPDSPMSPQRQYPPQYADPRYADPNAGRRGWDDDDDWERRPPGDDRYRSKKRKSLLSEIFDF